MHVPIPHLDAGIGLIGPCMKRIRGRSSLMGACIALIRWPIPQMTGRIHEMAARIKSMHAPIQHIDAGMGFMDACPRPTGARHRR
jgi:hypothetical protein